MRLQCLFPTRTTPTSKRVVNKVFWGLAVAISGGRDPPHPAASFYKASNNDTTITVGGLA